MDKEDFLKMLIRLQGDAMNPMTDKEDLVSDIEEMIYEVKESE